MVLLTSPAAKDGVRATTPGISQASFACARFSTATPITTSLKVRELWTDHVSCAFRPPPYPLSALTAPHRRRGACPTSCVAPSSRRGCPRGDPLPLRAAPRRTRITRGGRVRGVAGITAQGWGRPSPAQVSTRLSLGMGGKGADRPAPQPKAVVAQRDSNRDFSLLRHSPGPAVSATPPRGLASFP
jgi:hypothetical protein